MNFIDLRILTNSLLYSILGVIVFWISFIIVDKITPYDLWRQLVEERNQALATVVALGLALLATLFLGDVPGLELVRPLAVAVLGGLVTTAAINFFALPALYLSLRVTSVDELELPPLAGVAEQEIAGAAL